MVVSLALAFAGQVCGAAPAAETRVVLFDFESGIQGWWGNAWGGGECKVAPAADAKFGKGALTISFRDVKTGANGVSPYLDEKAEWRAKPWGGISLWLKGDGSPARAHIALETAQPGSTGYAADPPLEDATWHRLDLPWRVFWSREGMTVDPARLKRVIIGCTGTHEFAVDQIALEAPGSSVLTDADPSVKPGPLNATLPGPALTALQSGGYEVRLDLSSAEDRGDLTVRAAFEPPGGKAATYQRTVTATEAARGEVSLVLASSATADGRAKAQVSVSQGDGTRLAAWGYTFPVFLPAPEPARPPIAIYPVPKECRLTEGRLRFGTEVRAVALGLPEEDVKRTLGMFAREMRAYYGREVKVGPAKIGDAQVVILNLSASEKAPAGLVPANLQARSKRIGEEGYVLRVTPERAVIAANTGRGAYCGLQSLLAAIDDETRVPAEAAAPCCEIVDWPSLPFRAVTLGNPTSRWGWPNDARVEIDFFNDFVYRTVARQKLNKIVFIVGEGMQFDSHPELRAPNAWSKDELRRFVQFARDNYIEVIPLVTVLGHANWFAIAHPELREPGHDENIACVRKPETNRLIMQVIDEVIEVFQPKTFHLGMDECWWQTLSLPPEKRCPLCTGHWADIVAEQATTFRDALAKRGIRTMMWGDMLIEEHNGGAPYHTAAARTRIPKDMIIADWSWSLASDSAKRFRDAGIAEVVRSNSMGVPRDMSPWDSGNMMGLWSKMPWLTDSYFNEAAGFSYLALPQSAEFSWNLDPRLGDGRGLDTKMLDERSASLLRRVALRPSPNESGAQTPLDLGLAGPLREVTAGRVRFRLAAPGPSGQPNGIALTREKPEATIPVNQPAAAVYLVVTCEVPAADATLRSGESSSLRSTSREAFKKQWQKKDAILGVRIGTLTFTLADGTTEELPLRYGYNVMAWDRAEALPYLCGSLAPLPGPPPTRAFVLQWVNPRPGERVKAVKAARGDTEATAVVLAATMAPSK